MAAPSRVVADPSNPGGTLGTCVCFCCGVDLASAFLGLLGKFWLEAHRNHRLPMTKQAFQPYDKDFLPGARQQNWAAALKSETHTTQSQRPSLSLLSLDSPPDASDSDSPESPADDGDEFIQAWHDRPMGAGAAGPRLLK
eukprot:2210062-Amphidinium_carterae.4